MKERFTEGPWELGDENNQYCEVQIGETVCSLTRHDKMTGINVIDRDEMLANAHLIMTAPKMYDLLMKIKDELFYKLSFNETSGLGELAEGYGVEIYSLLKEARGE